MADIVIYGNGKAAQVARYFVKRYESHRIIGFTVDDNLRKSDSFDGYPLVSWENLVDVYPPGEVELLGPVTPSRLNTVRRDRFLEGKSLGYNFASFIHPDNHIHADHIGENCFILEQNVIHPFVTIGDNVMIWSQNHIGHHSSIGDHCFLSVGVMLGGACTLGEECYVGGGCGILENSIIGKRCAILNNVAVTQDLEDDSVFVSAKGELKPYPSSRIRHLI